MALMLSVFNGVYLSLVCNVELHRSSTSVVIGQSARCGAIRDSLQRILQQVRHLVSSPVIWRRTYKYTTHMFTNTRDSMPLPLGALALDGILA